MSTCPGNPVAANEPTTFTSGITVTPNLPQNIYSSNGVGNPIVSWNPTDEFCSLQFEATPGNQLVVPTTSWVLQWSNQDATTGDDATGNPAIAAGFGVPALAGTPVTGPATSGPITIGTNTVTFTIVSGTIRVSMPNGSLFGYNPGDPVSNAVIKVQWASPVHNLEHIYFDNGTDQTPTGLTNYQLSLASNAPPAPTAALSVDCTNVVTGPWSATLKGTLLSVLSPGPAQTLQFVWTDGTHTFVAPATPIGVSGAPQAVSADIDHLVGCTGYSYFLRWSDGTNVVDSAPCHFTAAGLFLKGGSCTP